MKGQLTGFALLLNRVALGLYFAIAGYQKVFQMGVANFYTNGFLPLKPKWLPEALATPYGYAIPYLELGLGALLIIGFFSRGAALILALMVISFTIAMYQAMHTLSIPEGSPFTSNIILATLGFLLFVTGPGWLAVDSILRPGWMSMKSKAVSK